MKFESLYKLLTEAPIGNLELKGDWNNGKKQGWDKPSQGILKSERGLQKVRRLWNKTSQDFDIYLLKDKNVHNFTEVGRVSPEFLQQKLGLNLQLNEDNITIVYTNNKGAELMPATPWTLAHRFGHALARENGRRVEFTEYNQLDKAVENLLEEIAEFIYNRNLKSMRNSAWGYGSRQETQQLEKIKLQLSHALGTFKSARDRNLRASFEFTNEIIAQHIITGSVKLNRDLPQILPLRFNWGTPEGPYKKRLTPEEVEELEDVLSSHENTLTYYVEELLNSAVGNVYVM